MVTRISPLDYTFASFNRGANLSRLDTKEVAETDRVILQFEKPAPENSYQPTPYAGWMSVNDSQSAANKDARYFNYIANYGNAHGLDSSDISAGLKIKIDATEVTLTTSGSYTSKADILTQLASDITSNVANVNASWRADLSRFQIEKTDGTQLDIAVGTSGANTDQNQNLLSLIQGSTNSITTSPVKGDYSQNGTLTIQSPWPSNSVILNGVSISTAGTDSLQGRIDAINQVTAETGVTATGKAARLELPISFGDNEFAETQNAATFDYAGLSINGVDITLGTFDPGDSENDVLQDMSRQLNSQLHEGPLSNITAAVEGNTIVLEAKDLNHGIQIGRGASIETALLDEFGGVQFAAPTIELSSQDAIHITSPYSTSSAPQPAPAEVAAVNNGPQRLHFEPPELARLYLPGGLLEGENAPNLTGQARQILAGDESLAWSKGSIYSYDKTASFDQFNAAMEANRSQTPEAAAPATTGDNFPFVPEAPQVFELLSGKSASDFAVPVPPPAEPMTISSAPPGQSFFASEGYSTPAPPVTSYAVASAAYQRQAPPAPEPAILMNTVDLHSSLSGPVSFTGPAMYAEQTFVTLDTVV